MPTKTKSAPYLAVATAEIRLGLAEGGLAIGSLPVPERKVIGRGHNRRV